MQSKNFYRFVNLLIVVLLALGANAVVHASTHSAVAQRHPASLSIQAQMHM